MFGCKKELRKGIEPASARKMKYEDIRRILVDDYLSSGKAVMDGKEILISGRRGVLKPLDDYFGGMNVANVTNGCAAQLLVEANGGRSRGANSESQPRHASPDVQTCRTRKQGLERSVLSDAERIGAA